LYSVSRDKTVRGIDLAGATEETRQALVGNGPFAVVPVDDAVLVEYAHLVDEFSIHDGLVVASHRATETDAIVTTDAGIRDVGVETFWD
jgi:hypothetical protein